eukprot:6432781-Pyramimonas_sp.AAC.1
MTPFSASVPAEGQLSAKAAEFEPNSSCHGSSSLDVSHGLGRPCEHVCSDENIHPDVESNMEISLACAGLLEPP